MKSYIINLDRSSERLKRMGRRFALLELDFERVPAVDGASLSPEDISEIYQPILNAPALTKGEIGCFLSHRRCWTQIASGPDAFGCIFEDDVILSWRSSLFLGQETWIPIEADIIKIETAYHRVWLDRVGISLPKGLRLNRLRDTHFASGGYILSRSAATHLLALTRRFSDAVDHLLFNPGCGVADGLTIYQMSPALCIQTQVLYQEGSAFREPEALAEHSAARFPNDLKYMPWLKRKAVMVIRRISHLSRGHVRTKVLFADNPGRDQSVPPETDHVAHKLLFTAEQKMDEVVQPNEGVERSGAKTGETLNKISI